MTPGYQVRMQLPAAYCRDPHRNRSGAPYDPQVIAGMEAFGRSVFAARKRAGLRQVDLARLCGLHQTTISRIENGVLPGLVFWRLAWPAAWPHCDGRPPAPE